MTCKIAAATMAAAVMLALLSSSTNAEGRTCGTHPCVPCPVQDVCGGGSNDACAAWCINEKYATGVCYGDVNERICVCEMPCSGEALHGGRSELPAPPVEPTGRA